MDDKAFIFIKINLRSIEALNLRLDKHNASLPVISYLYIFIYCILLNKTHQMINLTKEKI